MKRFSMGLGALMLLTLTMSMGWIVGSADPAHACSCMARSLEETIKDADVVALGTYETVKTSDGELQSLYSINVDKVYKGSAPETLMVATSGSSASCGWEGVNGEPFLFFLYQDGDMLTTNLCSGNLENPTAEELAQVKKLTKQAASPTKITPKEVDKRVEKEKNEVLQNGAVRFIATLGALLFVALVSVSSYRIIYKRMFHSKDRS